MGEKVRIRCSCGCNIGLPNNFQRESCHCPNCGRMLQVQNAAESPMIFQSSANPVTAYDPEELYQRIIDTVVAILDGNDFIGSGFFVNRGGLIVTNRHVVRDADEVVVRTVPEKEFLGQILRSFPAEDLAFIKTSAAPRKWATMAPRDSAKVGQAVYALGHPMGYQNSFTNGIISGIGRLEMGRPWLQTNAVINPGNSGGPLFDRFARVVGVNTWGRSDAQGIYFAVPSEVVSEKLTEVVGLMESHCNGIYCPICGHITLEDKYCNHCGATLRKKSERPPPSETSLDRGKSAMECRTCGSIVQSDQSYCQRCGSTIDRS